MEKVSSLIATSRCSTWSVARQTTPMPPRPRTSVSAYRPARTLWAGISSAGTALMGGRYARSGLLFLVRGSSLGAALRLHLLRLLRRLHLQGDVARLGQARRG